RVHPRTITERQRAVVRDHNRRAPLRTLARCTERSGAARALGLVGIDVRILEEPEAELVAQQPARGLVDALFGDASFAHELREQLAQLCAAELVAAGIDDLDQSVFDAELFDAPALRGEHRPVRE